MKRNFEKKQKIIARAYSKEKGREEELLYNSCHVTFASHTFDNEVKDFREVMNKKFLPLDLL